METGFPMSSAWSPPRQAYHLRVFAISLGLVFVGLTAFLLGVRMEAVEPATGFITSRDLHEIRSPLGGLIEPGWFEGEVADGGSVIRVRVDSQGEGVTDPTADARPVVQSRVAGRLSVPPESLRFHRLETGDELWPGQPIASLRTEEWRLQLKQIEDRLREWPSTGNHEAERGQAKVEAELLRFRLAQATLRVPERERLWLAVGVRVGSGQSVQAGDMIASIVPVDSATHEPLNQVARLEVEEKHLGDVAPGQTVRLTCSMYNHRLHGRAEAQIERIEPWGESASDGSRRFIILAPITTSPFSMKLGSSVKAEIIVGRKLVYRIILEH
jgi:hypothetical protein